MSPTRFSSVAHTWTCTWRCACCTCATSIARLSEEPPGRPHQLAGGGGGAAAPCSPAAFRALYPAPPLPHPSATRGPVHNLPSAAAPASAWTTSAARRLEQPPVNRVQALRTIVSPDGNRLDLPADELVRTRNPGASRTPPPRCAGCTAKYGPMALWRGRDMLAPGRYRRRWPRTAGRSFRAIG